MTKEIIENDPYKLAGVDIDAGNNLIDKIKKSVAASHNQNVLNNIGGFAGMYELDKIVHTTRVGNICLNKFKIIII